MKEGAGWKMEERTPKRNSEGWGQKNKNARTSLLRILTGFPLDFLKVTEHDVLTPPILPLSIMQNTESKDRTPLFKERESLTGKSPPFIAATLLHHFRHDLATGIPPPPLNDFLIDDAVIAIMR